MSGYQQKRNPAKRGTSAKKGKYRGRLEFAITENRAANRALCLADEPRPFPKPPPVTFNKRLMWEMERLVDVGTDPLCALFEAERVTINAFGYDPRQFG